MRLKTKIIVGVSCVVALSTALDYDLQRSIIYPQFTALEQNEARQDVERCREAVVQEIDQITALCREWAASYQIQHCVLKYHESDSHVLKANSFQAASINLTYVYCSDGKLIWGKAYQLNPLREVTLNDFPERLQSNSRAFLTHQSPASVKRGIVVTEIGPMLIASAPIIVGEASSESVGHLVVGRLLTDKRVAELSARVRIPFTVQCTERSRRDALAGRALSLAAGSEEPVVLERNDRTLAGFCSLRDIEGTAVLQLCTDVDREISLRARNAMKFASASLAAGGVLVLLLLTLLIQRIVIAPITSLTAHATAIGTSGDLSLRIGLGRDDETGLLAAEFNRMIGRLADYSKRLTELSRQAGMAQVASGVLHNVGNVLVSVTCLIDSIRRTLIESRMHNLRRLSELLEDHHDNLPKFIADDPRGMQVRPLVRQLAERWEVEGERLTSDVAALANNIQHIASIVEAQQRYATRTQAIESVRVDELLRDATKLCEHAITSSGVLIVQELDDELPSLRIDRVRTLDVIVNLIKNASESIACACPPDPTIRIKVSPRPDERLRIEVSDNGLGVSAENLQNLFKHGFTTKPNGHGFGLHFCANAVSELGGVISARSEGPDRGATFIVDLPCGVMSSLAVDEMRRDLEEAASCAARS